MGTEEKKKPNIFKRILFVLKLLIFIVVLVIAGVVGAFIDSKLKEREISQKQDEINRGQERIDTLVETIEDLEEKNNTVVTENQTLRDQLKTEEEKRREEELKKQLTFKTEALGNRLMTFNLSKPHLYFEFDKSYGEVTVAGRPAVFSDNVVSEGIEIKFKSSTIIVYIEPWKLSGLAFEKVSATNVKTADGKDAQINVFKVSEDKYLVSGVIMQAGDAADNTKLMVTKEINKDALQSGIDEVRDIVRSIELEFGDLD